MNTGQEKLFDFSIVYLTGSTPYYWIPVLLCGDGGSRTIWRVHKSVIYQPFYVFYTMWVQMWVQNNHNERNIYPTIASLQTPANTN